MPTADRRTRGAAWLIATRLALAGGVMVLIVLFALHSPRVAPPHRAVARAPTVQLGTIQSVADVMAATTAAPAPATASTPPPPPPPPVPTGPSAAVYAAWTRVATCEEGGWVGSSGSAFPDSLGINAGNWYEYGGGSDTSPAAQIAVAQRLVASRGMAGWVPDQHGCSAW